MEDMISVAFFGCFWCQVSVFRCQFTRFSFLKPDPPPAENLSKIPSEAKQKRENLILFYM